MKNKVLFSLLLLLLITTSSYPWGDKGHQLIMRKALEVLPPELNSLNNWKDYLEKLVLDADNRKSEDKSEGPKHYIDMDFYPQFLHGEMVLNEDSLINKYGKDSVTRIGLLPWTTFTTLDNLTNAFREKNRDKVLIYIADLGHYVGDGHQPMHTVLNYDGQLTGQKGVHFRYEVTMLDKYLQEIDSLITPEHLELITNVPEYVFGYICDSNFKNDILLASDKIASANSAPGSEDYFRILWFRTKNLTTEQLELASSSLAALIYTAWNNAGRPLMNEIN